MRALLQAAAHAVRRHSLKRQKQRENETGDMESGRGGVIVVSSKRRRSTSKSPLVLEDCHAHEQDRTAYYGLGGGAGIHMTETCPRVGVNVVET